MGGKRLFLIGIDGGTWDLIDIWIGKGKLPNFKHLKKNGFTARLLSTIPPFTTPAWLTCLKGKNPGKTGAFFFFKRERDSYQITPIDPSMIEKSDTFLNILSKSGKKVLSFCIPMTYPPTRIKGAVVSGLMTPPRGKFAYPDKLYEELKELGFRPEFDKNYILGNEKIFLKKLLEFIDLKEKAFFHTLDLNDYDLVAFFFRETDLASHIFWRFQDARSPIYPGKNDFEESILAVYKKADDFLGKIFSRMGDNDLLLVMSDYGFGVGGRRVNLNLWLAKEGFIKFREGVVVKLKKVSGILLVKFWQFLNSRISPLIIRLQWLILSPRLVKRRGGRILKQARKNLISRLLLTFKDVDWEKTTAYSIGSVSTFLPIFLNLKGREPLGMVSGDDVESVKKSLIEKLGNLYEDDKRVVKKVYRREDIYQGEFLQDAPDLVVEFFEGYEGFVLPYPFIAEGKEIFVDPPLTQSGSHRREGFFGALGSGVQNREFEGALNISDLMPTILSFFDISVPKSCDGEPIKDVLGGKSIVPFKKSSETDEAEPSRQPMTKEEKEKIIQRLKRLGYI